MHVLVVEDNELVSELVAAAFGSIGWDVQVAPDAAAARRLLRGKRPHDAVVLDIELPDADGFSVLSEIRRQSGYTPVIMLTARSGPDAAVKGLTAGADDYLAKPFDTGELTARVLAMIRRTSKTQEVLRLGDVSFNRLTRELTCAGRRVRLTPKEQTFIEQLLLSPDRPVSREELLHKVWRINFDPGSNLVDAHVARIRSKLKNSGANIAIVTKRSEGFTLEVIPPDPAPET
jgi:DNA-binding response OmpR family regulator